MAECKSCGKEIPEGTLYCSECETRMKADESYLDSLLSSVVANSVMPAPERPVKKTTAEPVASTFDAKEEPEVLQENFVIEELDEAITVADTMAVSYEPELEQEAITELPEAELPEAYDMMPEADLPEAYDMMQDTDLPETYDMMQEADSPEGYGMMPEADLPEAYDMMPEADLSEAYDMTQEADLPETYDMMQDTDLPETYDMMQEADLSEALFESVDSGAQVESDNMFFDEAIQENRYDIFNDTDDSYLDDLFADSVTEEEDTQEMPSSSEDELLDDMLRSLDGIEEEFDLAAMQADAAAYDGDVLSDMPVEEPESFAFGEDMEQEATEEASVLSGFGSYDEALDEEAALLGAALAEEVFATGDVSEAENEVAEEGLDNATMIEDTGLEDDFFRMLAAQEPEDLSTEDPFSMLGLAGDSVGVSEAFGAEEADNGMMDIWGLMNSDTTAGTENSGEDAFGDFPELFGEDDGLMNNPEAVPEESESSEEVTKKQKKKKKNIFKRIFGNVREDLTDEEIEARKKAALEKFEEDEQKAADEAAREKLHKEQREKLKEEEEAKKKAEKEALAKKKADEKRLKAEQKKLLKDKKEQAKRALLAEIEENEGKINKFGASIIIIMFAAVLCMITIGTSYYNYKISIDKAQFDFDLQRYDEAYNDVYGLEIKEEDMELYDKIMTVQYVNVQLLSYMRYNSLDMDAEALDSLIKGLRRYEKFIQHGTELGVKDDLNYLKTQIIEQLDVVFGIDEATAYEMLALETQEEYSVQIYDTVSKKN